MRLFVALELPVEIRKALGLLVKEMASARAQVRWVDPQNMHLTLKFLGEVAEEKEQMIYEVSRLAAKEVRPFTVRVEDVGAFPSARRPRVIWVGIGKSPQLATLARRLEEEFQAVGFPSEKRPWTPHLTLGRVKTEVHSRDLEAKLSAAKFPPRTFSVERISIVKSVLKPSGPVYTTLREIPLTPATRKEF
jgi:2'-5' RNA ligase